MANARRPLDGITVVSLEHAIAAPFCTRQLADLGARVIKVENPAGGDNGNNEQTATLAITAAAVDLLVNKTDSVGSLNLDPVAYTAGSTFLGYQVTVTNNGPGADTGVAVADTLPARRFGRPEEFGAACAFLCAASAGFMTGQNLQLDGGAYAGLV